MIDTHCHIDQYDNPESVAEACRTRRITTIAVTSLPEHYLMAKKHLAGNDFVHPALGLHPLVAAQNTNHVVSFERLSKDCDYIGEIGLDGSKSGLPTLPKQIEVFDRVLAAIAGRPRFVTLHSRGAVAEVLKCLNVHAMYPVVFHWFSGTKSELSAVLDAGHFLSFNPSMADTAKWQTEITRIPLARILTETDGPYTKVGHRKSRPADVLTVLEWFSEKFRRPRPEIERVVRSNFFALTKARLP